MSLTLHHLLGCAPTPLAHYLKALGILRILAEQKDHAARGWWQDEHFCLLTTLDRDALERFFLVEYAPTAFVAPWNKDSGFFAGRQEVVTQLERSSASRFAGFRTGIAAARAALGALGDERRKPDELKQALHPTIARSWRGAHRTWVDAAMIGVDDGDLAYPGLLGSACNDGRFEFTNAAMNCVVDMFRMTDDGLPLDGVDVLLQHALWATVAPVLDSGRSIGQFLPGSAGGPNSDAGPSGKPRANPWDLLLALEGVPVFNAAVTRRADPRARGRASAPFSVGSSLAGHGTVGVEDASKGEQWMPLWARPTTFDGVQTTLREGRVQLGARLARDSADVARAIGRLGVARGIHAFVRYGYLKRQGDSQLAVPLGRVAVTSRAQSSLLDDLGPWIATLQRQAARDGVPAGLRNAVRAVSHAFFAAATHDDSSARWQQILTSATEVEAVQAGGVALNAGPMPPLSPAWLRAGDDGSPEWRLACALGSASDEDPRTLRRSDPVRHHWLPLQPGCRTFRTKDRWLVADPRVVAGGRDPMTDWIAVVERRVVEAARDGERRLRLAPARGFGAHPADLEALLAGDLDLVRISTLARALMAVQWAQAATSVRRSQPSGRAAWPDEPWAVVRLAMLPFSRSPTSAVAADETILRRLAAGDAAAAVELAARRLRIAGLVVPVHAAYAAPATARLWAASLVFPIDRDCASELAQFLEPSRKENR